MRNHTRMLPIAATLLLALLAAGCAASPGDLVSFEDAGSREIAHTGGREPAGGTLVDGGGNAAAWVDPDALPASGGRLAQAVDPDAPVSSGQLMPAPDAPIPSRPVGSGNGGASGGGSSGMEPGVIYPTAPAEGAGSSGFAGEVGDLRLLYCGEDKYVHGRGRDLDARKCLWDAYLSNRAAAFRTVAYTIEGDPIAYDLDALGPDRIQVLVDSEDRFGATGEFLYTCTAMEFTDDLGFVLKGCAPNEPEGSRAFLSEEGELYVP